jgi:hypothetical protein
MTKRLSAVIIIANIAAGLLLYLSSQAILLHLASKPPILTLTGVNIDKIFIGAVQASSSPTPLIITAYPNLPFYVLWFPLVISAYFIIKTTRNQAASKRFPIIIIVANIILNLLVYLASQAVLLPLVAVQQNYQGIGGVNFWAFSVSAVSVGGSPIPLVVYGTPNMPSYAFLLLLIINAFLTLRLARTKQTQ